MDIIRPILPPFPLWRSACTSATIPITTTEGMDITVIPPSFTIPTISTTITIQETDRILLITTKQTATITSATRHQHVHRTGPLHALPIEHPTVNRRRSGPQTDHPFQDARPRACPIVSRQTILSPPEQVQTERLAIAVAPEEVVDLVEVAPEGAVVPGVVGAEDVSQSFPRDAIRPARKIITSSLLASIPVAYPKRSYPAQPHTRLVFFQIKPYNFRC